MSLKKEYLAVKLGIQAFRMPLLGQELVVVSDHQALEWLEHMQKNNSRLTHWSLSWPSIYFKFQYRQGNLNGNTDALPRLGVNEQAIVNRSEMVNGSEMVKDWKQC